MFSSVSFKLFDYPNNPGSEWADFLGECTPSPAPQAMAESVSVPGPAPGFLDQYRKLFFCQQPTGTYG
jgi:hypothetical protein